MVARIPVSSIVFVFALLVVGTLTEYARGQDLATGLLGYWPFDDLGTDCSGNDRHLEIATIDVGFAGGIIGDALSIPAGATFEEPAPAYRPVDDPELNFGSNDFTVQVWVNYSDTEGEQVLIEKFTGTGGPSWTITKLGDNRVLLSAGIAVFALAVAFEPGIWNQVIVRRESNTVDIFINNELLGSLDDVDPFPGTDAPLIIGMRNKGDGRGFVTNGLIDEVAIWNRPLSDGDIDDLYSDGFGTAVTEGCDAVAVRPNPPATVGAAAGETDVTVSWTAPAPVEGVTVAGYNVYRTRPGEAKLNTDPVIVTEFAAAELTGGIEYCFVVRAVGDNDLESDASGEACATPMAPPPPLTDGLLGYWPFDGDGTDCGGSRHLELAASVSIESGFIEEALSIPPGAELALQELGPAYRPVDDPELNFGASDFTIQAWVSYNSTQGEQVLMEKFTGTGGPGWTLTKLSNGVLLFAFASAVTSAPLAFEEGAWNQVVVRRLDNTIDILLNNEVVGSDQFAGELSTSDNPLIVGMRNKGDNRGFATDGLLDDVAIWGRALSDADIEELYSEGFGTAVNDDCFPPVTPNSPVNVGAVAGGSDVVISWSAPAPAAGVAVLDYNIFRTKVGEAVSRVKLNTDPVTATEFTADGLVGGREYCFVVRSAGDNGLDSDDSEEVCATPTDLPPDRPTEGLLGYWPFDEDGTDCSGSDRDLELAADEFGVGIEPGLLENALFIQNVLLEEGEPGPAFRPIDDPALNFGLNDFTVQVWVNYNDPTGEQVLIEKFSGTGGPGWTITKLADNRVLLSSGISVLASAVAFEAGVWYHVVVRRQSDTIVILIDDQVRGTLDTASPLSDTEGPLLIGMRNRGDGRGFLTNGLIDEVAIWDRALSDAEISLLYNNGVGLEITEDCTVPSAPPNPPANVAAAPDDHQVTISWNIPAPVQGVTVVGYNVYHSAPGTGRLNNDPVAGTEFTADDLLGGVEYCFVVRSIGDDGRESADSEEACATTTGEPPLPPVEGLLGFWPFDDDGSDCTTNERDLELASGVFLEPGLLGTALSIFPGGVGEEPAPAFRPVDDPELNFGLNDFTIQVWVNYNLIAGEQVLIEKFTGAGGPGWTLTKLADNRILFTSGVAVFAPTVAFEAGLWYQVVVRRAGSKFDIIINGQVLGTLDSDAPLSDTDAPLIIGMRNKGDGRDFGTNGFIDEVGIWNRALTIAEIGLLYSGGLGLPSPCDGDPPVGVGPFIRGDCDGNGAVGGSPTEAIVLLNFAFRGGNAPPCLAACDAEANGSIGVTDGLRILRHAFLGQGEPDPPFPACTTSDQASDLELGCETPIVCP